MELGSAITGAILIIICALPFISIRRNRMKKEKSILQSLTRVAAQNNCQIDHQDLCGNFAIGIDETKNSVFFYRQAKVNEVEQYVNLDEVQSCKIINTNRTFMSSGKKQEVIDKLELSFIPTTNSKPVANMEFFNIDMNIQLFGELELIKKWSKLINDRLNS